MIYYKSILLAHLLWKLKIINDSKKNISAKTFSFGIKTPRKHSFKINGYLLTNSTITTPYINTNVFSLCVVLIAFFYWHLNIRQYFIQYHSHLHYLKENPIFLILGYASLRRDCHFCLLYFCNISNCSILSLP